MFLETLQGERSDGISERSPQMQPGTPRVGVSSKKRWLRTASLIQNSMNSLSVLCKFLKIIFCLKLMLRLTNIRNSRIQRGAADTTKEIARHEKTLTMVAQPSRSCARCRCCCVRRCCSPVGASSAPLRLGPDTRNIEKDA